MTIEFKRICPQCKGTNYGTTCVGYFHAFYDDNQIDCSCGWRGRGSEMLLRFTDSQRGDVVICKGIEYVGSNALFNGSIKCES